MKNKFFAGFLALTLVIVSFMAGAAVTRYRPAAECAFVDHTGTNAFQLTVNATPSIQLGNSNYVGITTNVALFGGTTNQFRLHIVKGIVTAVVGP